MSAADRLAALILACPRVRARVAEDTARLRSAILAGDRRGGCPGIPSDPFARPEASNAVEYAARGPDIIPDPA